jgi:hypothetical protein
MLLLTFKAGESVTIWTGRRSIVLTRDNRPCDGSAIRFCLRSPRATGTHGVYIDTVAWYKDGRAVIGFSSDSSVHVRHSRNDGTTAGVYWQKRGSRNKKWTNS